MTGEHTPGPWREEPRWRGFISAKDRDWVADCGNQARNADECDANARLVAAAPDMLAALRSVVELCDDADAEELAQEAARRAKIAIVNATGAISTEDA